MPTFNVAQPTLVTYVNLYKATTNALKGLPPFIKFCSKGYSSLIKKFINELMSKDIEFERLKRICCKKS